VLSSLPPPLRRLYFLAGAAARHIRPTVGTVLPSQKANPTSGGYPAPEGGSGRLLRIRGVGSLFGPGWQSCGGTVMTGALRLDRRCLHLEVGSRFAEGE
jgi:hypothetical protein